MALIKKIKLQPHLDERGALVENSLPQIMADSKHFFVSTSKPGVYRGGHYHHRKSEWFYLIKGKCIFKAEDIKTHKQEQLTLSGEDHVAVNVGPDVAHSFHNVGDEEMILLALINEVFDQEDPDTYPYEVS